MATDYATLLNNYGWNNILAGLDAGRFTDEHHDGYSEFNVPGIGMVSRDPNGTVLFQDPESRAAYAATGNAPVYNYIGSPGGWSQYQVSHGGMSADTLGALAAAAITAGIGTGYIPGMESAGAGVGTGAMDMGIGGSGFLPEGYGGTAALSSGGSALGTAASGGGAIVPAAGGGFSIPSAAELSAAGFDPAGMGITGAGGIGSAGSLAASGAGAANYGAGMGIFDDLLSSIPSGLKDTLTSKAGSAIIGGLLGGINGTSKVGDQTITTQQQIDPRMASILYGPNGNNGFLSRITGAMDTPQDSALGAFGNLSNVWLGQNGKQSIDNMYAAANGLMNGGIYAPQATAAKMDAAQVNAPGQNGIGLAPAYGDMIYGAPGSNPYLLQALQKGIHQGTTAFQNLQTDATRNLLENVLPGIRSGAIVNGAMGSSRQGIAEGRAINDFSTQMGRAASQVGQDAVDAGASAMAGAYDSDRSRALSALTGLSGQQYGVAGQNASFQQDANKTNSGFQQEVNTLNPALQLQTDQLNTNRTVAGLNANGGLLGQTYGIGTNQDAYGLNKIGKVSGLLGGYTGLGGSSSTNTPLYQNTTGNILGGGLLGANIYNLLNNTKSTS